LFQLDLEFEDEASKAVLEQPSSRRMPDDSLGRRNIALPLAQRATPIPQHPERTANRTRPQAA
jgi:hypothetical protein